jgi:hypothetical protein
MKFKFRLLSIVLLLLIGIFVHSAVSIIQTPVGQNRQANSHTLLIPEEKQILEEGYPKNELGETYGMMLRDSDFTPDLLLAQNEYGTVGYIRIAETDENLPNSPEEAVNYKPVEKVNMYLQDGTTIIGEFHIGNK